MCTRTHHGGRDGGGLGGAEAAVWPAEHARPVLAQSLGLLLLQPVQLCGRVASQLGLLLLLLLVGQLLLLLLLLGVGRRRGGLAKRRWHPCASPRLGAPPALQRLLPLFLVLRVKVGAEPGHRAAPGRRRGARAAMIKRSLAWGRPRGVPARNPPVRLCYESSRMDGAAGREGDAGGARSACPRMAAVSHPLTFARSSFCTPSAPSLGWEATLKARARASCRHGPHAHLPRRHCAPKPRKPPTPARWATHGGPLKAPRSRMTFDAGGGGRPTIATSISGAGGGWGQCAAAGCMCGWVGGR